MNAPASLRSYSGVERAAVLMMLVGEEEAAAILQKLDPEEVRQLGKAMFAVADVGEPEVQMVLDDFVGKARDRTAIGFDPKPIIETMMTRALGPEKADSVLARITPPDAQCQIDLLDWMDAAEIAAMIEKEHPQIAAVVIANLDQDVAGQVLELLPDAEQPTLLQVDGADTLALQALCHGAMTWQRLEDLKRAGARGLMVLPVERMLA